MKPRKVHLVPLLRDKGITFCNRAKYTLKWTYKVQDVTCDVCKTQYEYEQSGPPGMYSLHYLEKR